MAPGNHSQVYNNYQDPAKLGRPTSQPLNQSAHAANAIEFNALHKHDGRGTKFLTVLFRRHGSILPRTLPIAFFSTMLTVGLMLADRLKLVDRATLPILWHPVSVQMFAFVLGFVIVLRCNFAVDRYFEGISHVQFFGSKWVDAYTQLCGFCRSSAKVHKRGNKLDAVEDLTNLQLCLLHYFSLLHGLAINSLQITQLDLDESDELFRRLVEKELPPLNLMKVNEKGGGDVLDEREDTQHQNGSDGDRQLERHNGLRPLTVLGKMNLEERDALNEAEGKVDLVHAWIIETITRANMDTLLLTQPPILSRVFQELSNGMLGYNQAYKIALIQFPFAFAQVLTLFLIVFVFCCPAVMYVFVGGEVLTPGFTFLTVIGYWGIHEVAVEVENPFGTTPNQLPMKPLHDEVCESLFEACIACLPDRGNRFRSDSSFENLVE